MNKRIIIVGSGGLARSISDTLMALGLNIYGIVDLNYKNQEENIHEKKIIGDLASINELDPSSHNIALAIGESKLRKKLYNTYLNLGYGFPNIIHPSTIVSNTQVEFGNGVFIGAGSIIMSDVEIGNNNIIYSGCIIEHECKIRNHCTLAPGVKMAGRVRISDGVTIGIGSTIRDKIEILDNAIIGAGSLVIDDVRKDSTVFGIPAKIKKSN